MGGGCGRAAASGIGRGLWVCCASAGASALWAVALAGCLWWAVSPVSLRVGGCQGMGLGLCVGRAWSGHCGSLVLPEAGTHPRGEDSPNLPHPEKGVGPRRGPFLLPVFLGLLTSTEYPSIPLPLQGIGDPPNNHPANLHDEPSTKTPTIHPQNQTSRIFVRRHARSGMASGHSRTPRRRRAIRAGTRETSEASIRLPEAETVLPS